MIEENLSEKFVIIGLKLKLSVASFLRLEFHLDAQILLVCLLDNQRAMLEIKLLTDLSTFKVAGVRLNNAPIGWNKQFVLEINLGMCCIDCSNRLTKSDLFIISMYILLWLNTISSGIEQLFMIMPIRYVYLVLFVTIRASI